MPKFKARPIDYILIAALTFDLLATLCVFIYLLVRPQFLPSASILPATWSIAIIIGAAHAILFLYGISKQHRITPEISLLAIAVSAMVVVPWHLFLAGPALISLHAAVQSTAVTVSERVTSTNRWAKLCRNRIEFTGPSGRRVCGAPEAIVHHAHSGSSITLAGDASRFGLFVRRYVTVQDGR